MASTTRPYCSRTEAASGWSKMLRTMMATQGWADLGVHVDGAASLADLDGQRIEPHERIRPAVERPVANASTWASR
jgi:hypothetical protein